MTAATNNVMRAYSNIVAPVSSFARRRTILGIPVIIVLAMTNFALRSGSLLLPTSEPSEEEVLKEAPQVECRGEENEPVRGDPLNRIVKVRQRVHRLGGKHRTYRPKPPGSLPRR